MNQRAKDTQKGQTLLDLEIGLPVTRAWLTPKEAADYLRISEDLVRQHVEAGSLTAMNVSANPTGARQHLRVLRESVLTFAKGRAGLESKP